MLEVSRRIGESHVQQVSRSLHTASPYTLVGQGPWLKSSFESRTTMLMSLYYDINGAQSRLNV